MDKYERLAKIVDPIIANIPTTGDDARKEYCRAPQTQTDIFKAIAVMNEFKPATDPAGQEAEREALKNVFRPVDGTPTLVEPVDGYGPLGSFIVSEQARALPEAVVAIATARTMLSFYRLFFDHASQKDGAVWDTFSEQFQDLILKS